MPSLLRGIVGGGSVVVVVRSGEELEELADTVALGGGDAVEVVFAVDGVVGVRNTTRSQQTAKAAEVTDTKATIKINRISCTSRVAGCGKPAG